jgi:hypothetical protein
MNEVLISLFGALSSCAAAYLAYKSQTQARVAARESTEANAAVNHRKEGQPRLFEVALEAREHQAIVIDNLKKISSWQDRCDDRLDDLHGRVSKVEAKVHN